MERPAPILRAGGYPEIGDALAELASADLRGPPAMSVAIGAALVVVSLSILATRVGSLALKARGPG